MTCPPLVRPTCWNRRASAPDAESSVAWDNQKSYITRSSYSRKVDQLDMTDKLAYPVSSDVPTTSERGPQTSWRPKNTTGNYYVTRRGSLPGKLAEISSAQVSRSDTHSGRGPVQRRRNFPSEQSFVDGPIHPSRSRIDVSDIVERSHNASASELRAMFNEFEKLAPFMSPKSSINCLRATARVIGYDNNGQNSSSGVRRQTRPLVHALCDSVTRSLEEKITGTNCSARDSNSRVERDVSTSDVVMAAWAVGRLQVEHQPLMSAVARVVLNHHDSKGIGPLCGGNDGSGLQTQSSLPALRQLTTVDIANLLWAACKTGYVNDAAALIGALIEAVIIRISEFDDHSIASIYVALAALESPQALPWIKKLTPSSAECADPNNPSAALVQAVLIQRLQTFDVRRLCNFVWAVGRLSWADNTAILDVAYERLRGRAGEMLAQHISNVFWCVAQLRYIPAMPLIEELSSYLIQNVSVLRRQQAQGISNIMWSVGRLCIAAGMGAGNTGPALFAGARQSVPQTFGDLMMLLAGEAVEKWRFMTSQHAGSIAWACGRCYIMHRGLFRALCKYLEDNAPFLEAQHLSNILWGLGRMAVHPAAATAAAAPGEHNFSTMTAHTDKDRRQSKGNIWFDTKESLQKRRKSPETTMYMATRGNEYERCEPYLSIARFAFSDSPSHTTRTNPNLHYNPCSVASMTDTVRHMVSIVLADSFVWCNVADSLVGCAALLHVHPAIIYALIKRATWMLREAFRSTELEEISPEKTGKGHASEYPGQSKLPNLHQLVSICWSVGVLYKDCRSIEAEKSKWGFCITVLFRSAAKYFQLPSHSTLVDRSPLGDVVQKMLNSISTKQEGTGCASATENTGCLSGADECCSDKLTVAGKPEQVSPQLISPGISPSVSPAEFLEIGSLAASEDVPLKSDEKRALASLSASQLGTLIWSCASVRLLHQALYTGIVYELVDRIRGTVLKGPDILPLEWFKLDPKSCWAGLDLPLIVTLMDLNYSFAVGDFVVDPPVSVSSHITALSQSMWALGRTSHWVPGAVELVLFLLLRDTFLYKHSIEKNLPKSLSWFFAAAPVHNVTNLLWGVVVLLVTSSGHFEAPPTFAVTSAVTDSNIGCSLSVSVPQGSPDGISSFNSKQCEPHDDTFESDLTQDNDPKPTGQNSLTRHHPLFVAAFLRIYMTVVPLLLPHVVSTDVTYLTDRDAYPPSGNDGQPERGDHRRALGPPEYGQLIQVTLACQRLLLPKLMATLTAEIKTLRSSAVKGKPELALHLETMESKLEIYEAQMQSVLSSALEQLQPLNKEPRSSDSQLRLLHALQLYCKPAGLRVSSEVAAGLLSTDVLITVPNDECTGAGVSMLAAHPQQIGNAWQNNPKKGHLLRLNPFEHCQGVALEYDGPWHFIRVLDASPAQTTCPWYDRVCFGGYEAIHLNEDTVRASFYSNVVCPENTSRFKQRGATVAGYEAAHKKWGIGDYNDKELSSSREAFTDEKDIFGSPSAWSPAEQEQILAGFREAPISRSSLHLRYDGRTLLKHRLLRTELPVVLNIPFFRVNDGTEEQYVREELLPIICQVLHQ